MFSRAATEAARVARSVPLVRRKTSDGVVLPCMYVRAREGIGVVCTDRWDVRPTPLDFTQSLLYFCVCRVVDEHRAEVRCSGRNNFDGSENVDVSLSISLSRTCGAKPAQRPRPLLCPRTIAHLWMIACPRTIQQSEHGRQRFECAEATGQLRVHPTRMPTKIKKEVSHTI